MFQMKKTTGEIDINFDEVLPGAIGVVVTLLIPWLLHRSVEQHVMFIKPKF
jgi:mannose/fructose/N-acetylgalactosamine-specific phosphotransferase system component IID